MKRYLYPLLLLSTGLLLCRDAATLAVGAADEQAFRPAGEQQHFLQARAFELSR